MNMKLAAALLGAGAAVAFAASPALAEKKLTYGSYLPAPHLVHKDGLEPLFKELKEKTNGEITYELFSGGAMGGGKAMLQITRDQVTDSSIIIDAYVKRDVPASATIAELAIFGKDNRVMAGAVNELQLLNCPQCREEQHRNKYKALAYYSTSTYRIMCTSKVNTLAAMEGKKIRATSAFGVMVKALGGTPVGITSSEIYEAMQRGQADCTVGSPAWLTSYTLKDVVKSILDLPVGTYHGALVFPVNANTWKSLTMDQKKIFVAAMPGLVARIVFAYEKESADAIHEAMSGGTDVELTKPGADLVAKLDEHRNGEYDRVLAKAKEDGLKNPEKMIGEFLSLIKKWEGIVAETGDDQAKYEKALWDNVFSKLDLKS